MADFLLNGGNGNGGTDRGNDLVLKDNRKGRVHQFLIKGAAVADGDARLSGERLFDLRPFSVVVKGFNIGRGISHDFAGGEDDRDPGLGHLAHILAEPVDFFRGKGASAGCDDFDKFPPGENRPDGEIVFRLVQGVFLVNRGGVPGHHCKGYNRDQKKGGEDLGDQFPIFIHCFLL